MCSSDLLPSGYLLAVIGENGAGKTTLIKIIAGLSSIDKGEVLFLNMGGDAEAYKQEIGLVLHEELFDKDRTLVANVKRYGYFYKNFSKDRFNHYLTRFHLDESKRYGKLSKGEKLKFSFAFALSYQPKLLLLDEPTANFDQEFRSEFLEILSEYTKSG